jgi:hypothetical protein
MPFTVFPAYRGQGPAPAQAYAAGKLMGFFAPAYLWGAGIRRYICFVNGIDQLITKGFVWIVAKDITKIIRSLQTTAVSRCRERLDAAALKARSLISKGENGDEKGTAHEKPEYGVTSLLKRRHGL